LHVTGPSGKKGASCKIKVSGEDQAMILPAIDDLRERLNAWLCPMCSSPLTIENVENLKAGKPVVCPFCNVSIGR
jgi:rubrerythrin